MATTAMATATVNLPPSSAFMSSTPDCLTSSGNTVTDILFHRQLPRPPLRLRLSSTSTRCSYDDNATDSDSTVTAFPPNGFAFPVRIQFLSLLVPVFSFGIGILRGLKKKRFIFDIGGINACDLNIC